VVLPLFLSLSFVFCFFFLRSYFFFLSSTLLFLFVFVTYRNKMKSTVQFEEQMFLFVMITKTFKVFSFLHSLFFLSRFLTTVTIKHRKPYARCRHCSNGFLMEHRLKNKNSVDWNHCIWHQH
jgi:hypothetical protein